MKIGETLEIQDVQTFEKWESQRLSRLEAELRQAFKPNPLEYLMVWAIALPSVIIMLFGRPDPIGTLLIALVVTLLLYNLSAQRAHTQTAIILKLLEEMRRTRSHDSTSDNPKTPLA